MFRSVPLATLLLVGLGVLLTSPESARAISLFIEPASQQVGVGETASVDLRISGLGSSGPPSLGAFLVELVFDNAVLSFDSVTYGGFLGDPSNSSETDIVTTVGPGSVSLDEFSFLSGSALDALQGSSFVLATITLLGTQPGISQFWFGVVDLSDAAFPASTLVTTLESGSVIVVPEPASLVLLLLGLLGIRRYRLST
jgi:hypothetical protein